MKVQSVTIEGIHNVTKPVTYQLQDFNYIVGKNGAGKSTVLEAIQLGILGYIPGTAKTNAAIMEHSNGPVMKVKIIFDNGNVIERSWATNGKTINADKKLPAGYDPETVLGELELPIFNFSEFLGLTANKAKDWFMNFLPGVDSNIDWNKELSEAVKDMNIIDKDLIANTVAELSEISGEDTVDMIRKCNEALKADQSFSKGELQKIQGTIQSLIYYDDVDSSDPDVELAQIKQHLAIITDAESAIHQHQAAVSSNQRIQSLLDTLNGLEGDSPKDDPRYCMLVGNQQKTSSKLNSLSANPQDITPPDTSDIDAEIKVLQEEYVALRGSIQANAKLISGSGVCPYTTKPCDSIKDMIEKVKIESAEAEKKIAENTAKTNELKAKKDEILRKFNEEEGKRREELRSCELELSSIEGQMHAIEKDYATRDSYKAQLVPVPPIDGLKTFEEYQVEKDQLMEKSNKIAANKKYNELIETLTADKYKIENTIEAYKLWIKLTGENGLQTTLMEAPFTDFEADMNTFIKESFGSGTECKFNLSTKANSFSYGIRRNNQFIPYNLLSSGEKAMYTFALMRCIVAGYDSQIKLLVVDDVSDHLDEGNLRTTFESLNNTEDIQIILAGVNRIDGLPGNLITIGA